MLSLKLGTAIDADDVCKLSNDLFNNSVYSLHTKFDAGTVRQNYLDSLKLPIDQFSMVLLTEDKTIGFIACSSNETSFSKDKFATELGFWIYPQHKTLAGMKKLLEAYYYWAKGTGCKGAFLGKLDGDKVETYRLKTWA